MNRDDNYLTKCRIAAAAEEWSERTGNSLREAFRRIHYHTRRQIIKPFLNVKAFEEFRQRNKEAIAEQRDEPRPTYRRLFDDAAEEYPANLSLTDLEKAGYVVIRSNAPEDAQVDREDHDFIRRTARYVEQQLRECPDESLRAFSLDYARLLGGITPQRRSGQFRWNAYRWYRRSHQGTTPDAADRAGTPRPLPDASDS